MHIIRHPAIRWMICIVLLVLMGYQLWTKSNHFQNFEIQAWRQCGLYIMIVMFLMPVNWLLETLKWHSFLSVHTKVSFSKAFRAVTGGIALSLFTPNRIGEYGGRLLFMPYSIRWPVVFSTLMGSISQNIVAFTSGIVAFMLLFNQMLYFKIIGILLLIISGFCFFKIKNLALWIARRNLPKSIRKFTRQLGHLEDYKTGLLLRSLLISLARYLVYTFQFVLLLIGFEPEASVIHLFLGVSSLYLFQTLVPMPPVADVLARTNIALIDRKSTRLNSSHSQISYAVFCLKKKKK